MTIAFIATINLLIFSKVNHLDTILTVSKKIILLYQVDYYT